MSYRNVLQLYIDNPGNERVVAHTTKFVTIRDAYPKALRHFLVLPRDPNITYIHPLVALRDPKLHQEISRVADEAKDIIVSEMVAEGVLGNNDKKRAEFKTKFIKAGVHAEPSLANLHVHVITRDFHSPYMKNKKHYNSFNTSFFVNLQDFNEKKIRGDSSSDSESDSSGDSFEISEGGKLGLRATVSGRQRRASGRPHVGSAPHHVVRDAPLVCSYCGMSFGSRFSALKTHLSQEFNAMKDTSKQNARSLHQENSEEMS